MNWLNASLWLVTGGIFCPCLTAQIPADTFPNAHVHYNFVLEAFNEIGDAADAYLAFSVHSEDSSAIAAQLQILKGKIQKVRARVQGRPGYKKDQRIRQGLLDLLEIYEEVFEDRVFTVETPGTREQKYARQEIQYAWQRVAEEKMANARNEFLILRMNFARDHRIKRRTVPISYVHARINELMDYCHLIEWARVRVVRQHAGFLDAMEAEDSALMKARRWDLLEVSSHAYNEVAAMPNFRGEYAYRSAALNLFRFYRELAAQDLPSWIMLVSLGSGTTRDGGETDAKAEEARLNAYTHAIELRNASVSRYNKRMPPLRDRYFSQRKRLQRKYVPRNLGK
ncbi:MAG: hypothetical protein AAFV07_15355 [Bacteroidota bacterium]